MNPLTIKGSYDFGEFRLDVPNRLLWRGEKQISLTIKEFDVLLILVENAGRVLSKDELLEAVWKDAFVEEATLARNISWLRKKLENGGEGDQTRFIETLPKRGYRFAAAVEKAGEQSRPVVVEEYTLAGVETEESIVVGDREAGSAVLGHAPVGVLPAPVEVVRHYRWLAILAFGILALAAISFLVYRNFSRESEPKVVLTSRVAPFSGLPGRENFPAFSPDGKLLAFVWNSGAGDNFDVYVRQTGTGAPVRLTNTKEDENCPVFSPDGSQIAFIRRFLSHSEVYSVPALGGTERKICDLQSTYSRLSFAPDGKTLVVADAEAFGKPKSIYFIDAASGAKRRATTPPETAADIAARFSPDGKTLAFLREFGGGAYSEIFIASVSDSDAAAARQLTFDKTEINGLDWSADGEKIIYALRTSAHAPNLRQISIGGGAPESIAVGNNITNPTVSRDGQTIAFVEQSHKTSIARLEPDAPARRFIESGGDDHSPNISPDNSQIAFVSNRTGNLEICIADAAGKSQRQLTNLLDPTAKKTGAPPDFPDSAGSPRFAPDGKFIAYDAHINGNGDIYVVSSGGGTSRRLTSGAGEEILPAWSADGKWIYFTSNQAGSFNLWKIPADGGAQAVQITKNGAFESFAAPDGKSIFYTRASDDPKIWQVSVGGGEESIAAADLSKAAIWRYWTVSPTGIYFARRQEDEPFYRINFYDFENRRVKTVAQPENAPIWNFSGLSVAADARTILYAQTEQNASTIMLADLPR